MSRSLIKHPHAVTLRPLVLAMAASGVFSFLPAAVWAQSATPSLPVGAAQPVVGQGQVTSGRDQNGPIMTVEQSSNLAVFRWDSFNVAAGATMNHVMTKPNPQALTVHHVYDLKAGPSMATIAGNINSDHRLFLISAGGVRVTGNAIIEAPSLLLTSHEMAADQFANGSYKGLVDQGVLKLINTTTNGGYDNGVTVDSPATIRQNGRDGGLALLGGQIYITGRLQSAGGKVMLAAMNGAEVPLTDSGFLTLKPQSASGFTSQYISFSGQIEAAAGDRPAEIDIQAGSSVYIGAGASMVSTGGPVNVSIQSAMSGGGQGEVYLAGYNYSDNVSYALSAAPSAVPPPSGVVQIQTGGGDVKISGQQGAGADGVVLSQVNIDAGEGRVDILSKSSGYSEGSNYALDLRQVSIRGSEVLIHGQGVGDAVNGVSIDRSDIHGSRGVVIKGVSDGAGPYAGIGLDVLQAVSLHGGAKGVELYGRGTNQGLRWGDLTLTTSAPTGGRFVIAGQTLAGAMPGIGLNPQFTGRLRIQDEQGRASPADLIIGGLGGPQSTMAIDLGEGERSPILNLSGRYNLRPLGVNGAGQVEESFDTPIVLGDDDRALTGRMVLLPEWFNNGAAGGNVGLMSTVIGSKGHRGQITTVNGALDGMSELTLQNQGAGAQGIQLGAGARMGTLNLVSSGAVTQTGALEVESLRVLVPEGVPVTLTDSRNQIKSLAYRGVGESSFGGAITPSSGGRAGISAFNPDLANGQFETILVDRAAPLELTSIDTQTQGERAILPRVLEEQRSDVYVRDAFSKPQVCTGVSTMGTSVVTDAAVEPLTLEWLKVRQSPQLSSCTGARVNASCSVF